MAFQKACPTVCFVVLIIHSIVSTGTSVMVAVDSSPIVSQTTSAAWLQNDYMRMGPGEVGTFVSGSPTIAQPFYYNGSDFVKLTFADYNMATVVHIDGAAVTPDCAAQSASWTGQGTGSISVTCSLVGETSLDVTATLEAGSRVAEFKCEVSGAGGSDVTIWFGTEDDWIGVTDSPSKTIGDFVGGAFREGGVGSSPGGRVIKVVSEGEGIYFWSTGDAKAIVANLGQDSLVAKDPSDQNTSVTGDSSYAVRFVLTSASPSQTVYYAAGPCGNAEFAAAVVPMPCLGLSAVGDPHLSNIRGEHFDVYQPGNLALVHMPRRAEPAQTLLLVEADARRMGDVCSIYFQAVRISGLWTNRSNPIEFLANPQGAPEGGKWKEWMRFGSIDLKIVRRTKGVEYLNVYFRNIGRSGYELGGLLGLDDHADVAKKPRQCAHRHASALVSSAAEVG